MMVQMFMEVAYEDNVTSFNKGLSMIKAVARAAAVVETTGAHGGKVPTDAEAIIIAEEKGMSWQQVVAISSVLFSGTVPTLAEIGQEGYGSDPGQWSSAKEARKAGKACMNTYIKSGDAEGYRTMITKGATRLDPEFEMRLGGDRETPHFAHNTWRRLAATASQASLTAKRCDKEDVELQMGWQMKKHSKEMRLHYAERGARACRARMTEMI